MCSERNVRQHHYACFFDWNDGSSTSSPAVTGILQKFVYNWILALTSTQTIELNQFLSSPYATSSIKHKKKGTETKYTKIEFHNFSRNCRRLGSLVLTHSFLSLCSSCIIFVRFANQAKPRIYLRNAHGWHGCPILLLYWVPGTRRRDDIWKLCLACK